MSGVDDSSTTFVLRPDALDTDLSGDAKATTFALPVTLGGWLF